MCMAPVWTSEDDLRELFFPHTVWASRIKPRPSDLVASASAHQVVLLAQLSPSLGFYPSVSHLCSEGMQFLPMDQASNLIRMWLFNPTPSATLLYRVGKPPLAGQYCGMQGSQLGEGIDDVYPSSSQSSTFWRPVS